MLGGWLLVGARHSGVGESAGPLRVAGSQAGGQREAGVAAPRLPGFEMERRTRFLPRSLGRLATTERLPRFWGENFRIYKISSRNKSRIILEFRRPKVSHKACASVTMGRLEILSNVILPLGKSRFLSKAYEISYETSRNLD